MANNTVNFTINIKDNATGKLKEITASTNDLGKMVRSVTEEVRANQRTIVDWAQASQAADMLGQSISELYGWSKDVTQAYQVQLVAETQLVTVMRQRMKATDEEVQSIKELCSAQQALGVIGDEVQLSGAQQMATFLNEKKSLDTLIPAMNNLLAQQHGLNSTNQDAVSIGNLMGKAMQGQTEVLQRVGISFSEAQKQVLKFGTESERAAVLAQVITENVGNMNSELAKTDAGKQKQLENTLGDIKEQIGSMIQPMMQSITFMHQFVQVGIQTSKVVSTIRSLNLAMRITANMKSYITSLGVAFQVLQAKIIGTSVAADKARIAMRAAFVTSGIGIAVFAISTALNLLFNSASSASDELDNLTTSARQLRESSDAYTTASSDAKAAIDMELASLKQLIDSHADDKQAVSELNSKYGEAFGTYKTAAEWYEVLTTKSETYCRAIGMEAQARELATKKAQNELRIAELQAQMKQMREAGTDLAKRKTLGTGYDVAGNKQIKIVEVTDLSDDYKALRDEMNQLNSAQDELTKKFEYCTSAIADANKELQTHTNTVRTASEDNNKIELPVELNGLDETKIRARLQQVQQAIDAAPTLEKKLELMPEKQQLEQMLADIKRRLDNAQLAVRIKVQQERDQSQGINLSEMAPVKAWDEVKTDVPDKIKAPEIEGADGYLGQLNTMQEETKTAYDSFKSAWGGLQGVGSGINSITDALHGNGNAWQIVTGVVNGFIQLYEGINAIVSVAQMFGLASKLNAAAKTQEAVATAAATTATTVCATEQAVASAAVAPVITANKLAAASYMELAAAAYMAAHAYIPFAGFGIAAGFATAAKAMVIAMGATPFAGGGLLYGPTLALAGEYPGASSNPEVIAPLDKLRTLINTDQGGQSQAGRVTFRLQGRELLGLMEREGEVRRRR